MTVALRMPKLGLTMESGTVVNWLVQPGQRVEIDQPLLEVETDKVVVEVESPATGTLGPLLVDSGQEAPVGALLAMIYEEGEQPPASPPDGAVMQTPERQPLSDALAPQVKPAAPVSPPQRAPSRAVKPAPRPTPHVGGRRFSSPRARKRARELGLDWRSLAGSGPNGRVIERDVLRTLHTSGHTPAATIARAPESISLNQATALRVAADLTALNEAVAQVARFVEAAEGHAPSLHDWMLRITAVAAVRAGLSVDIALATPEKATPLSLPAHRLAALSLAEIARRRGRATRSEGEDRSTQQVGDSPQIVVSVMSERDIGLQSIAQDLPCLLVLKPAGDDPQRRADVTLSDWAATLPPQAASRLLQEILNLIEEPLALLF